MERRAVRANTRYFVYIISEKSGAIPQTNLVRPEGSPHDGFDSEAEAEEWIGLNGNYVSKYTILPILSKS